MFGKMHTSRLLAGAALLPLFAREPQSRSAADGDGGEGSEPLSVIRLDESLAEAEKPPELPAGVYLGEVQDVQLPTSNKGNQYFAIKFVIPPEELAADIAKHYPDGAILYWNRNIVPAKGDARALWNLRKLVENLGMSADTTEIDPNEWMGKQARLQVRIGTYQNEKRAEIAAILPAEARQASAAAKGGAAAGKRRGR